MSLDILKIPPLLATWPPLGKDLVFMKGIRSDTKFSSSRVTSATRKSWYQKPFSVENFGIQKLFKSSEHRLQMRNWFPVLRKILLGHDASILFEKLVRRFTWSPKNTRPQETQKTNTGDSEKEVMATTANDELFFFFLRLRSQIFQKSFLELTWFPLKTWVICMRCLERNRFWSKICSLLFCCFTLWILIV